MGLKCLLFARDIRIFRQKVPSFTVAVIIKTAVTHKCQHPRSMSDDRVVESDVTPVKEHKM